MKHVITGGNGFLGKELAGMLIAQGEQVLIIDIEQTADHPIYQHAQYMQLDIRDKSQFAQLSLDADDIVYHFAAKLLMPIQPRKEREDFFHKVLYVGTENLLEYMEANSEARKVVYYTTDMVYGHTVTNPRTEEHPRVPLGPYGQAKYESELLCERYRDRGFNITLFRPRLIIGPGRLGILESLFKLIDRSLPVPLIGNGQNNYQFVSVSDCAKSCLLAVDKGVPNEAYNVGSLNPPTVNVLLKDLIKFANSKSILIKTWPPMVRLPLDILDIMGIPLMDPEQYLIAHETCVLDISKAQRELGFEPEFDDMQMLRAAYETYRNKA